ncbi:SPFH domain-containing protein, partial [Ornithobacterium rhinotracheale]
MGLIVAFNSCSRVEPNYEGVLMENYGRNGKEDFHTVVGRQWVIFPGTSLYQVPMFETSGDPQQVTINAKDAGVFQVDPSYQYQAIRGKGIDIVFNYKHLGITEPEVMMNNVEEAILNKLVINAYREEARNYTTDSLMNNLNK